MQVPLALGTGLTKAGAIVAALLVAAALLAPSARGRALAMAGALGLAPVLLAARIWSAPELQAALERPAPVVVLAGLALAAVAALAAFLVRRPSALPVVALAVMPFRVPVGFGGVTASLLVPLYVVIAAGGLAYLAPRLRRPPEPRERRPGALEWALLGFVVLYAAQATYSSDFYRALEQLVFFYVPFAVLFALLAQIEWTPRLVRACLGVLVALGLVFCAVGFVQYATGAVLVNPKVMASNEYTSYFRANSLFFDPNIYGRFLVVVILAVGAVIAWSRHRRELAACAAVVGVLWLGLLSTLSQSSLGALLVGLALLVALRGYAKLVAIVAGAVVTAGALLVLAAPGALGLRPDDPRALRKATSGRSDLLRGGAELWAARPLAGWGSGAFPREYHRQGKGPTERAVSASHTTPLTVAVEQGAIGLAAYIALLVAAFRLLLRRARDSLPLAALAAAFAALVFHTLVYAAFLEEPMVWALLGAAVGVRAAPQRMARYGAAGAAPPARTPSRHGG